MPTRCCVPGCATSGGHKFPKDVDLQMKWRVAIKRSDEKKDQCGVKLISNPFSKRFRCSVYTG